MFSSCKVFTIHWYLDLIKLVHALSLYASFIRYNESASHTHAICNISVEISMFSSCKVSTVSWYWDSVEFLSCPILIRNGQNVECMHAIFNIGRQFFYLEPLELVNHLKFWYASWGSWGRCSLTCGGGSQDRVRSCTNPPPSWDGWWCFGRSLTSQSCNTNHCPGESVLSVLNQQSFIILSINFAGSRCSMHL